MMDETITTLSDSHQRSSIVTILLASIAFTLVLLSIVAFLYTIRKEKILRTLHLIITLIIITLELAFFIAVIICCVTPSKSTIGQILATLLIILSFLSLVTLIYFLLEDILRDKVEPYPRAFSPFKSCDIQEVKSISRHDSPIAIVADEMAIPIPTPSMFLNYPRLPTPPLPKTPSIDKSTIDENALIFPQDTFHIIDVDDVRRELLAAMEERSIPRLEQAIQQVKDQNYVQTLKIDYERALELLNRLMKIEHMKIRVLRLNQATIAELHSYTKPPDEVSTVMRATLLLLGNSDKEISDWTQIQNLLGRLGKESIRRRCYELNPLMISVAKAREAKNILKNYDLLRVSEISLGLAAFFSWSMTMIEEREKLLEVQRTTTR